MDRMICPLLSAGEYTRNVSSPPMSCNCLQRECAWWDDELNLPCFKALLYYVKKLSQLKITGGVNTHSY